jgi:hypothetical protein
MAAMVRMVIRLFPVAMGEMVERVALDSMAALAEPEEMAATVAGPMASPEPMRPRVLPLKMAATQPTAPMVALAAWVGQAAMRSLAASMVVAVPAAMVETPALRAMAATAGQAALRSRTGEMAEMGEIPAWPPTVAREVPPEPADRAAALVRTEPMASM